LNADAAKHIFGRGWGLRFSSTPARLDFSDDFIDGDLFFRSDRLERFFSSASDVGDAGEQIAPDLRRQIQEVTNQHRGDRISGKHGAPSPQSVMT
jgi:hypothetical protein